MFSLAFYGAYVTFVGGLGYLIVKNLTGIGKTHVVEKTTNNLFKELQFKRTYQKGGEKFDEYAKVHEFQEHDRHFELVIDLPFAKSYKDLEKLLPNIDTVFGVSGSSVYRNGNRTALIIPKKNVAMRLEDEINQLFKMGGLKNRDEQYLTVRKVVEFDTYKEIYLTNVPGFTNREIMSASQLISYHYNNYCKPMMTDYEMYYRLYTTHLKDYYPYKFVETPDNEFNICLGETRTGPMIYNFVNGSAGLIIAGTAGSGKSNMTNYILCNLLENKGDNVELVLLDLKRVELVDYKDCAQTIYFGSNIEDTVDYFQDILEEVEERYVKMENCKARSLESYNQKNPNDKMKYRLIVIEEMMSLLGHKPQKGEPHCMQVLGRILSKSRACGIFFLLTTQRPTGDIIDKAVMANIGLRVGLKTSDGQESENIIGEKGLEFIKIKGRGKLLHGGDLVDLQSYHITGEKIEEITLKHTPKKPQEGSQGAQINKVNDYSDIVKKAYEYTKNIKKIEDEKEVEKEGAFA